jgi:CheY-like chemotaxis protein/anti-sigma regulatory factor (Ser/Thr protein kinase)
MPPAPNSPLALVVDDIATDRRLACAVIEKNLGWRTREAADGCEALAALADEVPSVVVTDLRMPDCDGLTLVENIRQSHPSVPVVLMTAWGSEKIALQALQRGAASYVPKAEIAAELADSLANVVSAALATHNRRRLLGCLTRVELDFVLENDPALIPVLVSHLQDQLTHLRLCDQNGLIRVGVALEEALLNGMYHGNLEVGTQLKQEDEQAFHRLIEERRRQPPYRDRRLTVQARLAPDRAEFSVQDEGPGFDPAGLPDPTDPANLESVGGRGLLLIRTFMDEVRFNAAGNRIAFVKRRAPRPAPGPG